MSSARPSFVSNQEATTRGSGIVAHGSSSSYDRAASSAGEVRCRRPLAQILHRCAKRMIIFVAETGEGSRSSPFWRASPSDSTILQAHSRRHRPRSPRFSSKQGSGASCSAGRDVARAPSPATLFVLLALNAGSRVYLDSALRPTQRSRQQREFRRRPGSLSLFRVAANVGSAGALQQARIDPATLPPSVWRWAMTCCSSPRAGTQRFNSAGSWRRLWWLSLLMAFAFLVCVHDESAGTGALILCGLVQLTSCGGVWSVKGANRRVGGRCTALGRSSLSGVVRTQRATADGGRVWASPASAGHLFAARRCARNRSKTTSNFARSIPSHLPQPLTLAIRADLRGVLLAVSSARSLPPGYSPWYAALLADGGAKRRCAARMPSGRCGGAMLRPNPSQATRLSSVMGGRHAWRSPRERCREKLGRGRASLVTHRRLCLVPDLLPFDRRTDRTARSLSPQPPRLRALSSRSAARRQFQVADFGAGTFRFVRCWRRPSRQNHRHRSVVRYAVVELPRIHPNATTPSAAAGRLRSLGPARLWSRPELPNGRPK